MSKSEKMKDLWGDEYTQHYDDDGNKTGQSRPAEDWLDGPYEQHFDNDGKKSGTSSEKSDWLDGSYTQHLDNDGKKTGTSQPDSDWLDGPYEQHYNNDGNKSGYTKNEKGFFGGLYRQDYYQDGSKHRTTAVSKRTLSERSDSIGLGNDLSSESGSAGSSGFGELGGEISFGWLGTAMLAVGALYFLGGPADFWKIATSAPSCSSAVAIQAGRCHGGTLHSTDSSALGLTPSLVSGEEQSTSASEYLVRDTYVREQPTSKSAEIVKLQRADAVQGVMVSGINPQYQWLKLTSGPQAGYFIASSNLSSTERPALDSSFSGLMRISLYGSVHSEPDRNSRVLTVANPGMTLNVVGAVADGLAEISMKNGVIGYVDRGVFSATNDTSAAPEEAGQQSSQNVNDITPQRRVSSRDGSENVGLKDESVTVTITCRLSYGHEMRSTESECQNLGGIVYQ